MRLLTDIRTIFDARGVDRLASAVLLEALIRLDDAEIVGSADTVIDTILTPWHRPPLQ